MIILLNGPIGVGKTTVARHLLTSMDRVALIDGELLTLVRPFDPHNVDDFEHACRTIQVLRDRHAMRGIDNFIITWILESPDQMRRILIDVTADRQSSIKPFLLLCTESELIRRIRARNRPDMAKEIRRGVELSNFFWAHSEQGKLGYSIDTTELCAEEVAESITAHDFMTNTDSSHEYSGDTHD